MVLYVIGLGLHDEKDITVRSALGPFSSRVPKVPGRAGPGAALYTEWNKQSVPVVCRGLEAVKRCSRVFLEAYTSVLMVPKERLVRVKWRTPSVHRTPSMLPVGRSHRPTRWLNKLMYTCGKQLSCATAYESATALDTSRRPLMAKRGQ